MKTLSRGKLHSLILSATEASKRQRRMLHQAGRVGGDKKLIWEVFAGQGLTAKEANDRGAEVEKKAGWDFTKAKDRKKFLRKLHEELPDEILMSPPSKLWAPSLEAKVIDHAGNQNELFKKRREDHDVILTFAALVYEV